MSTKVLRTADGWWVVRGDRAVPVGTKAVTTAELLADRAAVGEAAVSGEAGTPVADLVALSPVTTPCRVVAQMVDYRSHACDSGFRGDVPPAFFRSTCATATRPGGPCPPPYWPWHRWHTKGWIPRPMRSATTTPRVSPGTCCAGRGVPG